MSAHSRRRPGFTGLGAAHLSQETVDDPHYDTGKVGAEAARLLAKREQPVRLMVRDPEKATVLAEAGVDVAVGDLGVPATIDAAMRGVSAVVLVSPAIPLRN